MSDPVTGLIQLGLTEYEARAYVAIASIGEGGVGEISQESGIPRARVYDIMERLTGKGFVEVGGSKPLRYRANDPKRVMENLLDGMKATSEDVALQLNNKKKRTQENLNPVWIIPDERGIDLKIKELIDSSSDNLAIVTSSTSTLLRYATMISAISDRVKVRVMILKDAASFRGLLGSAKIMRPNQSSLPSDNGPSTIVFQSRKGGRTVDVEYIIVSDRGSLIIYRTDEGRVGMSIDDSLIDWAIRSAIERILKTGDLPNTPWPPV